MNNRYIATFMLINLVSFLDKVTAACSTKQRMHNQIPTKVKLSCHSHVLWNHLPFRCREFRIPCLQLPALLMPNSELCARKCYRFLFTSPRRKWCLIRFAQYMLFNSRFNCSLQSHHSRNGDTYS